MDAAVVLTNPKTPYNAGGAVRACGVFGVPYCSWTGTRVDTAIAKRSMGTRVKKRLPREERMRRMGVRWERSDDALDGFVEMGYTPVAVEVLDRAESLVDFVHPEKAVYVFGPEDGSISKGTLTFCHRFVRIPGHDCLNLAAAVNVVLYDRWTKMT